MKQFKRMNGVWELGVAGLAVGVVAVILAVVALILSQFQTQIAAIAGNQSTAYNITVQGITALFVFAQFLSIVAITLVGAYLISLLVRLFRGSQGGGPGAM